MTRTLEALRAHRWGAPDEAGVEPWAASVGGLDTLALAVQGAATLAPVRGALGGRPEHEAGAPSAALLWERTPALRDPAARAGGEGRVPLRLRHLVGFRHDDVAHTALRLLRHCPSTEGRGFAARAGARLLARHNRPLAAKLKDAVRVVRCERGKKLTPPAPSLAPPSPPPRSRPWRTSRRPWPACVTWRWRTGWSCARACPRSKTRAARRPRLRWTRATTATARGARPPSETAPTRPSSAPRSTDCG